MQIEMIWDIPPLMGMHELSIDSKKRFLIPQGWSNIFVANSLVVMLHTNKSILLFSENNVLPNIDHESVIQIHKKIDKSGRVTAWKLLADSFGIYINKKIWAVWRWNYVELFFNEDDYMEQERKSASIVKQFQEQVTRCTLE